MTKSKPKEKKIHLWGHRSIKISLVFSAAGILLAAFLINSTVSKQPAFMIGNRVYKSTKEAQKEAKIEKYAPDRFLIKLKPEAQEKIKETISQPKNTGLDSLNKLDAENQVEKIEPVLAQESKKEGEDLRSIYQVEIPEGKNIQEAISNFKNNSDIEYAEPDFQVESVLEPNDPYYHSRGSWGQSYDDLYGLKKLQLSSAWNVTTGNPNTVIAVIDTGAKMTHPDLAANIWTNSDEIPGNGRDDDHNGYVDDVHGWDFYNNDNDPTDDHGHGTHCSGTIGAVTNNALGVAGVNWQVKIMPVKFLSSSGSGYISDSIDAIYYAVDNGAKVLSNSWGGAGRSTSLQNAINYAHDRGVTFVAAAGNNNYNAWYGQPAGLDNVLTVAATDYNDQRASFSNYGNVVEVAAPGVDILSLGLNNNYARMSGTSMACPHAAGLAGLIYSKNPSYTPDQITQTMTSTADDLGTSGYDIYYGWGRINAARALGAPPVTGGGPTTTTPPNISRNPSDYRAEYLGQNGYPTLGSGDATTMTVSYKNTGPATWQKNTVNIGLVNPDYSWKREGYVMGNYWLRWDRPATFTQDSVAPGETGTFQFTIRNHGGLGAGNYRFDVGLVAENITWFNSNTHAYWNVYVLDPYKTERLSQSDNPTLRSGELATMTISYKNTGSETWQKNTVNLGLVNPDYSWKREGYVMGNYWLRWDRPATFTQDSVPPGGVGTFQFTIKNHGGLPAGNYRFDVGLVAENITWFGSNTHAWWNVWVP